MSLFHSFNIEFAEEYNSVHIAIMIHHFQHWIMVNKRKKKNFIEGRTWTYQTIVDIAANFPYFSVKQVERILNKMVELKILIKSNFNKSPYDRTVWYCFYDEIKFSISRFREMENLESGNENPEIGNCINDIDTKTDAKEREREGGPASTPTPPFFTLGKVKMTTQEHESLVKEFGISTASNGIKRLNDYLTDRPDKKYASHAKKVKEWIIEDSSKIKKGSSLDDFKHKVKVACNSCPFIEINIDGVYFKGRKTIENGCGDYVDKVIKLLEDNKIDTRAIA